MIDDQTGNLKIFTLIDTFQSISTDLQNYKEEVDFTSIPNSKKIFIRN